MFTRAKVAKLVRQRLQHADERLGAARLRVVVNRLADGDPDREHERDTGYEQRGSDHGR